jgi:hypothetical protein
VLGALELDDNVEPIAALAIAVPPIADAPTPGAPFSLCLSSLLFERKNRFYSDGVSDL